MFGAGYKDGVPIGDPVIQPQLFSLNSFVLKTQ